MTNANIILLSKNGIKCFTMSRQASPADMKLIIAHCQNQASAQPMVSALREIHPGFFENASYTYVVDLINRTFRAFDPERNGWTSNDENSGVYSMLVDSEIQLGHLLADGYQQKPVPGWRFWPKRNLNKEVYPVLVRAWQKLQQDEFYTEQTRTNG